MPASWAPPSPPRRRAGLTTRKNARGETRAARPFRAALTCPPKQPRPDAPRCTGSSSSSSPSSWPFSTATSTPSAPPTPTPSLPSTPTTGRCSRSTTRAKAATPSASSTSSFRLPRPYLRGVCRPPADWPRRPLRRVCPHQRPRHVPPPQRVHPRRRRLPAPLLQRDLRGAKRGRGLGQAVERPQNALPTRKAPTTRRARASTCDRAPCEHAVFGPAAYPASAAPPTS